MVAPVTGGQSTAWFDVLFTLHNADAGELHPVLVRLPLPAGADVLDAQRLGEAVAATVAASNLGRWVLLDEVEAAATDNQVPAAYVVGGSDGVRGVALTRAGAEVLAVCRACGKPRGPGGCAGPPIPIEAHVPVEFDRGLSGE